MFCPKCGKELLDGSVICNSCGEHFEMELQRGRYIKAKSNSLGILSDFFHSKRHLTLSVFLSVLCGVSFLCGVISFNLEAILTFVFSLIAMIASWQLYTSKDAPASNDIKKLRNLKRVWHIFSNIAYIALIVCLVMLIILLAILGATWNTVLDALEEDNAIQSILNDLYEDGIISADIISEIENILGELDAHILMTAMCVALIVLIICISLFVALYIVYSAMLKKSERYIMELENTCRTGEYNATKCPGKFMIVMGIIYSCVVGSTSFSISLEDFGASFGLSNLLPLATGAYLVCLGIMLKGIHEAELNNNQLIAREEAELARVARLTNEAVRAAKAAEAEAPSDTEANVIETTPEESATDVPSEE